MRKNFQKLNKKIAFLLAVTSILLTLSIGESVSFIKTETEPVLNEFLPVKVTCEIEETFENGVKSDVYVRNTGDVDAFIRATVVVNFVSDDGKVLATAPVENTDYSVTWGPTGWKKGSDGFWYFESRVVPGGATSDLVETATAINIPDGYRLNIQMIASAIQSDPETAVEQAWGVTVENSTVIPR